MSDCGCNSHPNPCSPAERPCDPLTEPLQSALDNFITQFFGTVVKTCDADGNIDWTLPCDLATGITGISRETGEGLACYFKRIMTVMVTDVLPGVIEAPNTKAYVLLREAPYAGQIQFIAFATASDECTFKIRINGVDVPGLIGLVASSTPDTASPTAGSGLWAIGDLVELVVTALNTLPADFDFTLAYQKQPAT